MIVFRFKIVTLVSLWFCYWGARLMLAADMATFLFDEGRLVFIIVRLPLNLTPLGTLFEGPMYCS